MTMTSGACLGRGKGKGPPGRGHHVSKVRDVGSTTLSWKPGYWAYVGKGWAWVMRATDTSSEWRSCSPAGRETSEKTTFLYLKDPALWEALLVSAPSPRQVTRLRRPTGVLFSTSLAISQTGRA